MKPAATSMATRSISAKNVSSTPRLTLRRGIVFARHPIAMKLAQTGTVWDTPSHDLHEQVSGGNFPQQPQDCVCAPVSRAGGERQTATRVPRLGEVRWLQHQLVLGQIHCNRVRSVLAWSPQVTTASSSLRIRLRSVVFEHATNVCSPVSCRK